MWCSYLSRPVRVEVVVETRDCAFLFWLWNKFILDLKKKARMSVGNGEGASSTGNLVPRKSGMRTALEFTGIPSSWLSKRPKLPSRNWLIFLTVTSSVASLYFYDRQQCKKIRRHYVERVKHLSEEPMGSMDWPRKVTVYGCKWPGDEEYEQSMKYFRKYVKVSLRSVLFFYSR